MNVRPLLSTLFSLSFCVPMEAQLVNNGSTVPRAFAEAEQAMHRGEVKRAEGLFLDATQAAPRFAPAYLGLGLIQLREGRVEEATLSLKKASSLNPDLKGAHLFLGMAEYQAGHLEDAKRDLEADVKTEPDNVEALTWLGIVELGSGHAEEAVAPLDRAARLNPSSPDLLYYRGRAHSLVASAVYRQLYDQAPDSALVHRALAESLADSNQPERAIVEYQAAIRQEPGNADLYEGVGEQEQKLSHFDTAREAYQQELLLHPSSGIALYNLGKMDVEANRAESGVAFLRRAVAQHMASAPVAFYLGYGLAQLGQNEEAAQWLQDALTKSPSLFIQQSALFQLSRVFAKMGRAEEARRASERLRVLKTKASPENTATGSLSTSGVTTGTSAASQEAGPPP